jgi:hypothetical protein
MAQSRTLCIGMEVHTDTIAVAYVAQDHGAEVPFLGTIGTRQCDIDPLVRTMPSKATQLIFVYDAGPCGDWLSRYRTQKGDDCWVVAPSLMPKNRATASQLTVGTRRNGLAGPARRTAPRGMSRRWKLQPFV